MTAPAHLRNELLRKVTHGPLKKAINKAKGQAKLELQMLHDKLTTLTYTDETVEMIWNQLTTTQQAMLMSMV